LLEQFYSEVLARSLPDDEIGERWWDGLDGSPGAPRTLVAVDGRGQVVGGVVTEWFERSKVLLVSYVAVLGTRRGQGTGTLLMRVAARELYDRPGCQLVLGEIEDPRHWHGTEQSPVARAQFYARLGVQALAVPYFQPSVGLGKPPVYHMLLASFDASKPAVLPGPVASGPVVRDFIEEYLECSAAAGGEPAGSPDAVWLRSWYDGGDIALLPLLAYEAVPDPAPPGYPGRRSAP
jgi:GNAT superfamily N-acetyltransferase